MSAGIITVCQRQRCMRGFTPSTRIGAKSSPPTERGESYSTLAGFFKQYELVYVVGDERDLIRLRTSYREPREDVYVYRAQVRSEEHTSELQSHVNLVCRLLLEKKKKIGR